jgi:uncharacterized protein (DUF433 family)
MRSPDVERRLYGGLEPRDKPRYTLAQAARYLHLSPATLRSWIRGRSYPRASGAGYFAPLLKTGERLSFSHLIEAHVLRALRVDQKVTMSAVREALDYAEKEFRIERLLLSQELLTTPGNVFLERYGQLINLGRSGQLAAEQVLKAHLRRIEWDGAGLPARLFPASSMELEALALSVPVSLETRKVIVIDPRISFGRPVVASRAIRTSAIVGRIDAGEPPDTVAQDYRLEPYEIEAAILYERSAA